MKKNKIQNHGLDLAKEKADTKPEDWVFGVSAPVSGLAENIPDRKRYLPIGEIQKGKEDTMGCASRGPVNIGEFKSTYLYQNNLYSPSNIKFLEDNKYIVDGRVVFADAPIAIGSGTTKRGNSMIAPLEFIRNNGLVPKSMCPLESWMRWDDYHNPARITKDIIDLGLEHKERFPTNYERVLKGSFNQVIDYDILDVAGYAWPSPINGEYPRVSYTPNHVFVYFEKPPYEIFDNYLDRGIAGDFIKNLASNYALLYYGYRLIVNENESAKNNYMKIRAIDINDTSLEPNQYVIDEETKEKHKIPDAETLNRVLLKLKFVTKDLQKLDLSQYKDGVNIPSLPVMEKMKELRPILEDALDIKKGKGGSSFSLAVRFWNYLRRINK